MGYRLNSMGYVLQSMGYMLHSMGYRLNSMGYVLQSVGYLLQSMGYRLNTMGYEMQSMGYLLQSMDMQQRPHHMHLSHSLSACCLLSLYPGLFCSFFHLFIYPCLLHLPLYFSLVILFST
jgi:hypothetical protein